MKKYVRDCERYPFFYGFSYFAYGGASDIAVCYPIPLNIIIAVFRTIYFRMIQWSFKKLSKIDYMHKLYEKQFQKSYKIAHNEGYKLGMEYGRREATNEIHEKLAKEIEKRK